MEFDRFIALASIYFWGQLHPGQTMVLVSMVSKIDEMASNETLLKPYFNKVSDARFTADEKAVIALNYSYDKS